MRRLQSAVARFGEVSGLKRLAGGFQEVGRFAADAFRSVAKIVEPLGLITGALSIAGLTRLTLGFGEMGQQLGFTANRIGISVSSLQAWQGAARLAGADQESLTSGLTTLRDTMVDAIGGRTVAQYVEDHQARNFPSAQF